MPQAGLALSEERIINEVCEVYIQIRQADGGVRLELPSSLGRECRKGGILEPLLHDGSVQQ